MCTLENASLFGMKETSRDEIKYFYHFVCALEREERNFIAKKHVGGQFALRWRRHSEGNSIIESFSWIIFTLFSFHECYRIIRWETSTGRKTMRLNIHEIGIIFRWSLAEPSIFLSLVDLCHEAAAEHLKLQTTNWNCDAKCWLKHNFKLFCETFILSNKKYQLFWKIIKLSANQVRFWSFVLSNRNDKVWIKLMYEGPKSEGK